MSDYKVAFRVDGNSNIGMGHISRCVSIALALRKMHTNTIFLLSDSYPCDFLDENKLSYDILNIDYKNIDNDLDCIRSIVNKERIDCIFVDSYFASNYYLENLMQFVHVACIDGLYQYNVAVDLVLNYNAAASSEYYKQKFYKKHTKLLIGNKYVPLKPDFWNAEVVQKPNQGNKVLITTGSTDPLNVCDSILSSCKNRKILSKLDITVVVGSFFNYYEALKKKWGENRNIHFVRNCNNLLPLMQDTNVAVSAAGTTAYELLRLEIPSILFAMTDNQLTSKALSGRVIWIGDIRDEGNDGRVREDKMENIAENLEKLCFSKDEYFNLKTNCRDYIDGLGAERIAEALLSIRRQDD